MREGEEEEVDEEERDETMSNDILKLGELKCVRGRLQSICETQSKFFVNFNMTEGRRNTDANLFFIKFMNQLHYIDFLFL